MSKTNSTAQKKDLYNFNGIVSAIRTGTTDHQKTPFANFTLIHDTKRRDGSAKKTLVNAYGAAALKLINGGFAKDGVHIRVAGVYADEQRQREDGTPYSITIFNLVHCEVPKSKQELDALRAAKRQRMEAAGAPQPEAMAA